MSDAEQGGRTPPQNRDAERSLLGALLLDPERIAEVAETVRPEDFFDRRNEHIFNALVGLTEQSLPIDFVSVGEALRAAGTLEEIGGNRALVDLAQLVASSAHTAYHARLVSETGVLRKLIREATEIVSKAFETRPDGNAVQELLDDSEHRIFQISGQRDTSGAETISDTIAEVWKRIDARSDREGLTGLPTGFTDLDAKLCGLNQGDLIILAARPSMGKTALALNIIANAASTTNPPPWVGERSPTVLFYSLEMGKLSVVERMLCTSAQVEAHRLKAGRLSSEERGSLTEAADQMQRTKVFIDDTPGLSLMALRSRARRLRITQGLDMIVVDYLQLLTFPRAESRQQEISSISRALKGIARELEIPVIALAQLSRAVESRDDKRPMLSDLRESGSIEQDADVVMMLYRPEYYEKMRTEENRGLAEVIVAKHRNGPTGDVKLNFQDTIMRFTTRSFGHSEAIEF